MNLKIALFDLDGTLVDSLEDLTDAVNHMLASMGKEGLSMVQVKGLVGKGARNLVHRALDTHLPTEIEQGLALFTSYNAAHIADKSRLYPDAFQLLERLQQNEVQLAVISNKQEKLSRLILDTLGIGQIFTIVCGGDTFAEMKPSPLPLLEVLRIKGVDKEDAVMIGDSINDIEAGINAGIATIGCTWGYGGPGELDGADRLADSCDELADILDQMI